MATPSVSWYGFLHDFTNPGIDTAIDELEATGATGANMAMVYHPARDLFPTNLRRRMRFKTGGTHYLQADRSLYSDGAPARRVDPEFGGSDPARDVVDAPASRDHGYLDVLSPLATNADQFIAAIEVGGDVLSVAEPMKAIVAIGKRDVDKDFGDIVAPGIAHPCTSFDRWRFIPIVDDGVIVDVAQTYF